MKGRKKKSSWTISDIPSQKGRLIIVTGTGGLGYETALALARAGAEVILAGRNRSKGEAALKKIRSSFTSANIHFEELDLADLASVEAFANRMRSKYQRLDVLINNASVMLIPHRKVTKDGFELHFGTNYLGHFALTAHLMPLLRKGRNPRVVNVCALAARSGVINFDDLQSEHQYKPMTVYRQSKLSSLVFSLELHRRSASEKWGVKSIAVHPGIARTNLIANGTGENSMSTIVHRLLGPILFQSAAQGALPTLFAATSSEAVSGQYYGPDGFNELRGFPTPARISTWAKDVNSAKQLWEASKQLTNVDFDIKASTQI